MFALDLLTVLCAALETPALLYVTRIGGVFPDPNIIVLAGVSRRAGCRRPVERAQICTAMSSRRRPSVKIGERKMPG